jgi:hypothetical protein
MTLTPFELVEKEVAAFNGRDIEAFLETFADDATLDGLTGSNGSISGRGEIREHFGGRMSQWGLNVEILSRIALGPWIVDHEIVHRPDGDAEQLAIYEVREGLIRHVQVLKNL